MKKIITITIFCVCLCLSCNQKKNTKNNSIQQEVSKSDKPHITFDSKEYNFGTIDGNDENNEVVKFQFKFTNKNELHRILSNMSL